jgi:hypothetical protein
VIDGDAEEVAGGVGEQSREANVGAKAHGVVALPVGGAAKSATPGCQRRGALSMVRLCGSGTRKLSALA